MKKAILIILIFFAYSSFAQTSTIKGVVTYFFNDYQGDKPDIGAKIFVIDSISNPTFNPDLISTFLYGKTLRHLYFLYSQKYLENEGMANKYEGKKKRVVEFEKYKKEAEENKKVADSYYSDLVKNEIETEEKHTELGTKVYIQIVDLEILDKFKIVTTTVDGIGNYSIAVIPGTYYILIQSKGRTSLNVAELQGKLFIKKVVCKENQTIDLSYNFGLN